MCGQCPGYRNEVNQVLFATASSYWVPGLSVPFTPLPTPSPSKQTAAEGSAKPCSEQPSTSADIPSGKQKLQNYINYLSTFIYHLNFNSLIFCCPFSFTASLEYRCPPHGSHLICTCCLQPMPDRRAELINGQQPNAQQCELSLRQWRQIRLNYSIMNCFIIC